MWSGFGAILLTLLLMPGAADPQDPSTPTAEEIGRAIEALADEDFVVRERASEFLWRAGKAAGPALTKALHSRDPEVAARASRILRQFQYGIFPGTPTEVVALIGRYRFGTQADKLAVLKELLAKGETASLLTLLKTESDEELRRQLTDGLLKDLDKLAGAMFINRDWARAEQLLEIGATSDDGMRNYAAYLLLRAKLEAKISELTEHARRTPNAVDAKLLAYLLRARGDLSAARSAAEAASDPLLTAGILFELGDWRRLARLHADSPEQTTATLPGGIVDLGYAAAYHRLAGNAKEFQQSVAAIRQLAETKPNKLWYCAETLIINEQYQQAVELLRQARPTAAFEILCLQLRFGEALRLAGVAQPQGPFAPWFAEPGSGVEVDSAQRRERFSMGLLVASLLWRLNEKQKAADLFAQLARAASDDHQLSLQALCETQYRLGLTDQAWQHAAVVLSGGGNTSLLRTLFPEYQEAAAVWWRFFCEKYPQEPRATTLRRIRRLLAAASANDPPDEDWRKLVAEAQTALQGLGDTDRSMWLAAIGESCLARGERRAAQDCFLLAAHLAPSPPMLTRLGDLASEDTQWDDAARWYRSGWEADRTQPTPLYLQGRALVQAGRESEGRTLIEAARLLPLGNAQVRSAFAEELERRGLGDEALHQWQVTLHTGELQCPAINQAAQRLGDTAVGKDDLQAATYWQWPLLRCLRTSTNNPEIEGYLRRAYLSHRTRARGLLAAGRIDEALEEIRLGRAALPGDVELPLELVPLLEKAGRRADADRLFGEVFAIIQAVCADFPRSHIHHHDLARLAAGCRRRLDEGLAHANQAVALDPKNPAYLGTLRQLRRFAAP